MSLQKYFKEFDEKIKIDYDVKSELKEKRDILLEILRNADDIPSFTKYDQGSYSMHLGVEPLDKEYDIDVGLRFHVNCCDYSPMDLKDKIYELLKNHTDYGAKIKKPCVTVTYKKDGEAAYHVDLVVYTYEDKNDTDSQMYLARGKNSESDETCWEKSDPVGLVNYVNDKYNHLVYSTKICTDDMSELLSNMEQIYGEIEGATDITLGSPFSKIDDCAKENEFTIKILLPLFRKLGFANVKYNHGNKEFGKDITFARRTEFDDYEYYGVQVKHGDVSGGAQGEINELIQQAKDSFSMPYYDVYSRNKVRVSKVIIAISGKFTQNAVEKIIEGVTEYPLKNNLIFLDREKIEGLMSKYNRF